MKNAGGPESHTAAKPGRRPNSYLLVLIVATSLGIVFCGWQIYSSYHQRRLDRQLILAVENRKEETAVSLIQSGADPNARDESGGATLTLMEWLFALLGRSKAPKTATSALVMAFNRNEMKVVNALLMRGARIGTGQDTSGVPFIILAVKFGNADTVQMLIQKDPKCVNSANVGGDSAVAVAVEERQWEFVTLLLDGGANALAFAKHAHSALYRAIQGGASQQIIQRLVSLTAKRMDKAELGACLDAAVNRAKLDVAQTLFSMGGRIKESDDTFPSITSAATDGDIQKMKVLLSFGADIDAHDPMGSPMCQAAGAGQLESVRFLIDHGAEIDCVDDREECSALMMASQGGHIEVVKVLLDNGANYNLVGRRRVDFRNYKPITALSLAIEKHHDDVTRLLKQAGARK